MIATPTKALRKLADEQLEAEVDRLQRELDRLDGGYWPSACAWRTECLDALSAALREQQRRSA